MSKVKKNTSKELVLQLESSHISSAPNQHFFSLKVCITIFPLPLQKKEAPLPDMSKLFANVLSQWKIRRPFKKQSGVERLVDQRKQYSNSVSLLIGSCSVSQLMRHLHVCIFHLPWLKRHMISRRTIGISTAVVCLFKNCLGNN